MTFASSDEDIVKVNEDGVALGIAPGTATITAPSWNGEVASIDIRVAVAIESFTLPRRVLLPIGETVELAITGLQLEDADLSAISWTFSEDGIAEIDGTTLRALANYETSVTLTGVSWNGVSASTAVVLTAPNVTGIADDAFDGCASLNAIRGAAGSEAERFAANHGITFIAE